MRNAKLDKAQAGIKIVRSNNLIYVDDITLKAESEEELKSLLMKVSEFSHSVVSNFLRPHEPQHARPPCPSPTPGVYPNSCPLSQWSHLIISSSAVPFSSCLQSFPTSGFFQRSQLFASGGQNIGVSASTSVLPMNTQDQYPLGWTGCTSYSPRVSRLFSNTTVQKNQFFSAQPSLWPNSHISIWLLRNS